MEDNDTIEVYQEQVNKQMYFIKFLTINFRLADLNKTIKQIFSFTQ